MNPDAVLRCLVVDDESHLRSILLRLLTGEGFRCREAAGGREALEALEREPADLVISDIRMPGMDGLELLAQIRARWPETAVVMVTAVSDVASATSCLTQGALDYVAKPFQVEDVQARVRQALDKRRLILENRDYQRNLERKVEAQARHIGELFLHGVQSLAHALEAKDRYTRGHSSRVADYTVAVARALGLDPAVVEELRVGAELHDVGKIGVRESVLNKPAPLTDEEYRHIMEHTVIGERILTPLVGDRPRILQMVRSHHERFGGGGLPDGLRGGAIPLPARIVTVADAFDAMTTGRAYRPARTPEVALEELRREAGAQFDAAVVGAFDRAFRDLTLLPQAPAAASADRRAAAPAAAPPSR